MVIVLLELPNCLDDRDKMKPRLPELLLKKKTYLKKYALFIISRCEMQHWTTLKFKKKKKSCFRGNTGNIEDSNILPVSIRLCWVMGDGLPGSRSCISCSHSGQFKSNTLHLHSVALSKTRYFTFYTLSVPQTRFLRPVWLPSG